MVEYEVVDGVEYKLMVGFKPLQGRLVNPYEKFHLERIGKWGKPVWPKINPYLRKKLEVSKETGVLSITPKFKLDSYEWKQLNGVFRNNGWKWKKKEMDKKISKKNE